METGHEFQPVQGESILISAKKSLQFIWMGVVAILTGLELLWWCDWQIVWWGGVFGIGLVIMGVLLPPLILWDWLVRKEKLVIGSEYLQVVVSKGGKDVVKTQIALNNVESVTIREHLGSNVITFQLHDINPADLVPPGGEYLVKYKEQFGFHRYIEDHFQLSGEALCMKITQAANA